MEDDPFPSLLPALLLLAGSVFGGLYALVRSPLRANLLAAPAPRWRARAEALLESPDGVAWSARLLRALFVIGACLLAAQLLISEEGKVRWGHLIGLVLFGGFVLDGIPAQVVRGRLLGIALAAAPIAQGLHACGAWLNALGARVLRRESPASQAGPRQRAEQRAAQLLGLAHAHQGNERLGSAELKMIGRLLDLPETDAATVMTPRTAITAVPAETTVAQAIDVAAEEGHTRIPVFDSDLDHVLGVFHIKDVLGLVSAEAAQSEAPVRQHMRPALNVPETVRLPALLEQMQAERVHLAIVVDEYGGTAGVVTIEDLLEEIVGEIEDEHDSFEDVPQVYSAENGEIIADGAFGIFDLNEAYAAQLPEDESYETLAGLLFDRLGHIPSPGEVLELPQVRLEVLEADDRRVQRVRIERRSEEEPLDEHPESDAA